MQGAQARGARGTGVQGEGHNVQGCRMHRHSLDQAFKSLQIGLSAVLNAGGGHRGAHPKGYTEACWTGYQPGQAIIPHVLVDVTSVGPAFGPASEQLGVRGVVTPERQRGPPQLLLLYCNLQGRKCTSR